MVTYSWEVKLNDIKNIWSHKLLNISDRIKGSLEALIVWFHFVKPQTCEREDPTCVKDGDLQELPAIWRWPKYTSRSSPDVSFLSVYMQSQRVWQQIYELGVILACFDDCVKSEYLHSLWIDRLPETVEIRLLLLCFLT